MQSNNGIHLLSHAFVRLVIGVMRSSRLKHFVSNGYVGVQYEGSPADYVAHIAGVGGHHVVNDRNPGLDHRI